MNTYFGVEIQKDQTDEAHIARLTSALDEERERNQQLTEEIQRLRAEIKYQAAQISAFLAERVAS